jgi:hypothetical protein
MHTAALATINRLSHPPTGRLRFSQDALRALGSLALSTPGVLVDFNVDDAWNAYATISRRRGQCIATVSAAQDGMTVVADHTGATLATLEDDEAGIRWTLRCEIEGGGSRWQT